MRVMNSPFGVGRGFLLRVVERERHAEVHHPYLCLRDVPGHACSDQWWLHEHTSI